MRSPLEKGLNSFLALVTILAIAPTFASAATAARALPAPDRAAAESCVADPAGPITLYGSLPASGLVDTLQSLVQIFPASDTTSDYLQQLENNVNGVAFTIPSDAANDPNYLNKVMERARTFAAMPQMARAAPIVHTGQFICRGFNPGKYEFFATLQVFANTRNGGSSKTLVTQYYRSSVDVPKTRTSKGYVGVPAFHLVGQVPK